MLKNEQEIVETAMYIAITNLKTMKYFFPQKINLLRTGGLVKA